MLDWCHVSSGSTFGDLRKDESDTFADDVMHTTERRGENFFRLIQRRILVF